ncbi:MetQ/NlpA family ABC transporter substrate-binding protein [Nocardioides abyssi]|uniref:MetQ/NlpA family ABC transporter substrate-binding protein n=1 Tax=Nocardioides abyssi TaxID=3058370 RepID=A0ABT8EUA6_9ACTN|nr:MetQ/NlpA family ABC transporter substrate-binding protein [Nocardioides abyssi]MDN4161481.1 MetQ/NlpA family ABC transporter substrate-binding protein [Nocardioides abyssi]
MSTTPSTGSTPLIEAPRRRRWPLVLAALVAVAVVVGLLVALTGGDDEAAADRRSVRLGVVGASDPYWADFQDAAAEEGIDVEVVDFADYNQPNPAVAEGDLDMNQFQHIVFLADYDVASGEDLQPIGATAIYPLGLHSKQYDSVEDIPDGATVAVPNDASNQARALVLLQSAGLIELRSGGTIFSDLADVDEDASRVEVKALDAALTATSLEDLAGAVVNNDFVEKAGLDFDDALAQDDPNDPKALPYANIFAVRADDVDDPTYRELVEIYQETQAVQDGVREVSGGTAVMLDTPVEQLQESLRQVEADTRAQQD